MPIVPIITPPDNTSEGHVILQPHEILATLLSSRSTGSPGAASTGYVDANGETTSIG